MRLIRTALPVKSLSLLLFIGLIDLVVTAVLHAKGLIVEMNPLMRFFIDRNEWLFAVVKAATLGVGWYFLAKYAQTNREFVHRVCLIASGLYVSIWLFWFIQTSV